MCLHRRPADTLPQPIKYVFIMATLYAVVAHVLDAQFGSQPQAHQLDTVAFKTAMQRMLSLIGYMVFFIQLPVAAAQRLMFRSHAYNVAECYTALLFFNGHLLAFGILGHVTGLYATRYGSVVIVMVGLFYFVWAIVGLYQDRGWRTLSKAIQLYMLYTAGRFAMGSLTMLLIMRLAD